MIAVPVSRETDRIGRGEVEAFSPPQPPSSKQGRCLDWADARQAGQPSNSRAANCRTTRNADLFDESELALQADVNLLLLQVPHEQVRDRKEEGEAGQGITQRRILGNVRLDRPRHQAMQGVGD